MDGVKTLETYRCLSEYTSDGLFVFDTASSRFIIANDTFVRISGYSREDLFSPEFPPKSLGELPSCRHRCIRRSRHACQNDRRGEGVRTRPHHTVAHLGPHRPCRGDGEAVLDHTGEESLPPSRGGAGSVGFGLLEGVEDRGWVLGVTMLTPLADRTAQALLEERCCLGFTPLVPVPARDQLVRFRC